MSIIFKQFQLKTYFHLKIVVHRFTSQYWLQLYKTVRYLSGTADQLPGAPPPPPSKSATAAAATAAALVADKTVEKPKKEPASKPPQAPASVTSTPAPKPAAKTRSTPVEPKADSKEEGNRASEKIVRRAIGVFRWLIVRHIST